MGRHEADRSRGPAPPRGGWCGMRVALGSPLIGVGLELFVGLMLWLGRPDEHASAGRPRAGGSTEVSVKTPRKDGWSHRCTDRRSPWCFSVCVPPLGFFAKLRQEYVTGQQRLRLLVHSEHCDRSDWVSESELPRRDRDVPGVWEVVRPLLPERCHASRVGRDRLKSASDRADHRARNRSCSSGWAESA